MSLLGGVISISNISTLLFVVFGVLMVGYAFGRITIKGISFTLKRSAPTTRAIINTPASPNEIPLIVILPKA